VPSGNSAAADVLQRLALLTGETEYERAGVSALRLVREPMAQAPTGFGATLCALDLYLSPAREVAIVGDLEDERTRALAAEVTSARFLPNHVLTVSAPHDEAAFEAVELLKDRVQIDDAPTAYVCEHFACKLPVTDVGALVSQLTS
jgi:uncharacterized protein YyaL (SSP411 family)